MTRFPGALLAAAALPLLASSVHAQGADARVLPRGVLELRVMGTYTQFGDRFGPDGRVPLGSGFDALIAGPGTRVATLVTDSARQRLEGFYLRTQGRTGGEMPLDLVPGTPRALLSADFRDVPLSIALGLSSRITVEASTSFHRRGTVVRGLTLDGTTLGIDPDPTRNGELLLRADSAYGRTFAGYLPLSASAAGRELQRRVRQLAGDSLTLPGVGMPIAPLLDDVPRAVLDSAEALMLRAQSGRTPYYLGDTYLGVRLQLARNVDAWAAAGDSGATRGVRAAVAGRVRIPTGARAARYFPLQFPPDGGYWGVAGDAVADWFLSRRWWISAGGDLEVLFPADGERLAFTDANLFPDSSQRRTVRRDAGARWGVAVTPRYRLTREIAFAGQYAFRRTGATEITDAEGPVPLGPIERTDASSAHLVGVGMSYSTLTAYRSGDAPFPAEVSLLYRAVVAGNGYAPRAGLVELTGRLYAPLFGRRARTTPAAEPAQPPARPLDTGPTLPMPDSIRPVQPDITTVPRVP